MDIRAYQTFLQLAKTLHFGKTAAHCHLSASAVSRQLQRLEDSVGQTLVERDNRHVRLTPAGRHFLVYARKAVEAWQQLHHDLNASPADLSGEISVYGSVTASYSVLTHILPTMRSRYPGIELKLRTGDQADGLQRVLAGQEDCAIIAQPDVLPARLAFQPLQHTPLHLIGPCMPCAVSEHLDQALATASTPDWQQLPVVLAELGLARERFLDWLKQAQLSPPIYAQVAGHEAVVAMVSLGFGVAVVPELVIRHSPARATIRRLPWLSDLPAFDIGLCAVQERLKDPLLQALWGCTTQ